MSLLEALEQASTVTNTKGGEYYSTTYNSNLNMFSKLSRFSNTNDIILEFHNAYNENRLLALANLLYILDIREGKGERRLFKIIFKDLCSLNPEDAKIIMSYIPILGRYDYILEGLSTSIEDDVIDMISNQLKIDSESNNPSLLAKWLPSHRTHKKNSKTAKHLINKLGMTERDYRKLLASLRSKINIIEKDLTNGTYSNINFENVPTKAMLKYYKSFNFHLKRRFHEYKESLKKGEAKVNTNGLFCYEIIKHIFRYNTDRDILNAMWENQKSILSSNNNVLVVADTSGSMTCCDNLPISASIGLAIYTAEHNKGIFQNRFITFSSRPVLQKVEGNDIYEKCHSIKSIVDNTDIDEVFKLLLNTATTNKIEDNEMPSHIIIISDMEFDRGVYSEEGTNFNGWKEAYRNAGYSFPKIVFWNVASKSYGVPVTKNDNDCVMISGFSTNLLEHLFDLENYNPYEFMIQILEKYLKLL